MELIDRQLFFSHTWKHDQLDRNNHFRVCQLSEKLKERGWTVWIDEENLIGNIDAEMANGIEKADAIIICLTEAYCKKVNESAMNPRKRDNCLKEWTYANARNKLMIPVVMEPFLLDTNNWPPGIISLYLGSTLYVDGTHDDLYNAAIVIHKLLLRHGIQPKLYNNNITNSNITNSNSTNNNSNSTNNNSNSTNNNMNTIINSNSTNNNILYTDRSPKYKYNSSSKKNILRYLPFNTKVFPLKEYDIRRNSDTPDIIRSSSLLYKMHKKWKSTGQIKAISI